MLTLHAGGAQYECISPSRMQQNQLTDLACFAAYEAKEPARIDGLFND
jgi:hypothetical protein